MLLTLAGIVLDGKTADGEVGVAAGSDVGEGNTLGERITGLESRHFFGCYLGFENRDVREIYKLVVCSKQIEV